MFWQLLWCVAVACGPGQIKTDIGMSAYTKEQCVSEAHNRLDKEPNKLFVCRSFNPEAQRAYWDKWSAGNNPETDKEESIFIGPRTLSY